MNAHANRSQATRTLFDMHCHLDFCADPAAFASQAHEVGLGLLAVGVEPRAYGPLAARVAESSHLRLAVGAHPWWVCGQRRPKAEVAHACELLTSLRYAGEIGLDFSPAFTLAQRAEQAEAFTHIARTCARDEGKVLSIHAVRSAGAVLDALDEAGALANCTCIFHWFSGTGEELQRAIRAGAWFSINERQLATRRGREYARQIPEERLLLESDLPGEDGSPAQSAGQIKESLNRALHLLAEIRGLSADELELLICEASEGLLAPA